MTVSNCMTQRSIILVFGIACLCGCAEADKHAVEVDETNAPPPVAAPQKSMTREVIEGFTGKTTVEQGKQTMDKAKDINEARRKRDEDIDGMLKK